VKSLEAQCDHQTSVNKATHEYLDKVEGQMASQELVFCDIRAQLEALTTPDTQS
jgi:hypothetical protein